MVARLLALRYDNGRRWTTSVDTVRRIAEEINAWAHFYAFGTLKLKEPTDGAYPLGRLNHLLPEETDRT